MGNFSGDKNVDKNVHILLHTVRTVVLQLTRCILNCSPGTCIKKQSIFFQNTTSTITGDETDDLADCSLWLLDMLCACSQTINIPMPSATLLGSVWSNLQLCLVWCNFFYSVIQLDRRPVQTVYFLTTHSASPNQNCCNGSSWQSAVCAFTGENSVSFPSCS